MTIRSRLRRTWHAFTLGRTALPAIASWQSPPGSLALLAMTLRDAVRSWIPIGVAVDVVYREALDVPAGEIRVVIEVAP